jgi:hypothetical protein
MNFKIDMSKFQAALDSANITMKYAAGIDSSEYKAGFDTRVLLTMIQILTESDFLKVTKVRKTK